MTEKPAKVPAVPNANTVDALKDRIDTARLLDYLQLHALGNVEMTASEAAAAKYLISKVLPDAKSQSVDGNDVNSHEEFLDLLGSI